MCEWRGKCLQNAVAGFLGRDASRYFAGACQNHEGSGVCGTLVELLNFEAVVAYLRSCSVHVRVFSAESVEAFQAQEGGGRVAWALGDAAGPCFSPVLLSQRHFHDES